jgi:hypothetical protein
MKQENFKYGDKVKDLSGIEGVVIANPFGNPGMTRVAFGEDGKSNWRDLKTNQLTLSSLPSAHEEGKLVTMLDSLLDLLIKGDVTIKSKSGAHWDLDELNQNLKDMYEALKEITRQYEITATTLEAEFNSHFDIKDYPSIQKAKSILSRISKQQNF